MKERPILFSGEMVQAILSGQKTQTRRPMKMQPPSDKYQLARCMDSTGSRDDVGKLRWVLMNGFSVDKGGPHFSAPYETGDRLWIRETWWGAFTYEEGSDSSYGDLKMKRPIKYAATETPENTPNRCYPKGLQKGFAAPDPYCSWFKLPSIHMPRWASRITLEIVSVRAERLHGMTQADAFAEGFECIGEDSDMVCGQHPFAVVWNAIYKNWDANPWVWVVEFQKYEEKTP